MTIYGYVRTSLSDTFGNQQLAMLMRHYPKKYQKIFKDQAFENGEFNKIEKLLKKGDQVIVCGLYTFFLSNEDISTLLRWITSKKAEIIELQEFKRYPSALKNPYFLICNDNGFKRIYEKNLPGYGKPLEDFVGLTKKEKTFLNFKKSVDFIFLLNTLLKTYPIWLYIYRIKNAIDNLIYFLKRLWVWLKTKIIDKKDPKDEFDYLNF
jgi:hypothetical protein